MSSRTKVSVTAGTVIMRKYECQQSMMSLSGLSSVWKWVRRRHPPPRPGPFIPCPCLGGKTVCNTHGVRCKWAGERKAEICMEKKNQR